MNETRFLTGTPNRVGSTPNGVGSTPNGVGILLTLKLLLIDSQDLEKMVTVVVVSHDVDALSDHRGTWDQPRALQVHGTDKCVQHLLNMEYH